MKIMVIIWFIMLFSLEQVIAGPMSDCYGVNPNPDVPSPITFAYDSSQNDVDLLILNDNVF